MKIKRILYFVVGFLIFLCNSHAYAQIKKDSLTLNQSDSSKITRKKSTDIVGKNNKNDTPKILQQKARVANDTGRKNAPGTTIINNQLKRPLEVGPAVPAKVDSGKNNSEKDTSLLTVQPAEKFQSITNELLLKNKFINIKDAPVYFIEKERQKKGKEFLFYSLSIILLILGVFKTFYSGYFNTLFRVFFNTSLRQTQLSDQLLQAKLPSFILNIFFTLSGGIYIWLLFTHFHPPRLISSKLLLPFCILSVAILYFLKFCLLKFMGWVSDIQEATDNYIFVIFLINKITGILLIPFIILMAFSLPQWYNSVLTISLLVLGMFFLSRYIKTFGTIEKKIKLNSFQFIIYITGIEIVPLLIIYKVAVDYLI
jgi:hypothetical protein